MGFSDMGVSFVPGAQGPGSPQGGGPAGAAPASPLQSAIQMLSLRLPRVAGPGAIAPGQLMNGPGGAGLPQGQMSLDQLLAHLFGPAGGPMGAPAGPGMAAPTGAPGPHVIPGQGGMPGGPTPAPMPGPPQPQTPRDAGMVDRTMPGNYAGTYRTSPWSARPGMGMGGDAQGAVDRLGRFGGMR
jgi:hypothetical protein